MPLSSFFATFFAEKKVGPVAAKIKKSQGAEFLFFGRSESK